MAECSDISEYFVLKKRVGILNIYSSCVYSVYRYLALFECAGPKNSVTALFTSIKYDDGIVKITVIVAVKRNIRGYLDICENFRSSLLRVLIA